MRKYQKTYLFTTKKNEQIYKTTEHLMIPLVITIFYQLAFSQGSLQRNITLTFNLRLLFAPRLPCKYFPLLVLIVSVYFISGVDRLNIVFQFKALLRNS